MGTYGRHIGLTFWRHDPRVAALADVRESGNLE